LRSTPAERSEAEGCECIGERRRPQQRTAAPGEETDKTEEAEEAAGAEETEEAEERASPLVFFALRHVTAVSKQIFSLVSERRLETCSCVRMRWYAE